MKQHHEVKLLSPGLHSLETKTIKVDSLDVADLPIEELIGAHCVIYNKDEEELCLWIGTQILTINNFARKQNDIPKHWEDAVKNILKKLKKVGVTHVLTGCFEYGFRPLKQEEHYILVNTQNRTIFGPCKLK